MTGISRNFLGGSFGSDPVVYLGLNLDWLARIKPDRGGGNHAGYDSEARGYLAAPSAKLRAGGGGVAPQFLTLGARRKPGGVCQSNRRL